MIFSLDNNLYDTIEFEAKEQVAAFYSNDLKEGVNAFLEKRKAKFLGK
jgi:enoyl-CoA hydratase/carnithine racemase